MSSFWVCWLLPLTLVLFLGQPSHAYIQVQSPRGFRGIHSSLEKQMATIVRQSVQDVEKVLHHLNKKHSNNYRLAPGETNHVMVQTVFGRAYHINVVLVKCLENDTADLHPEKKCEISPDAPKIECSLDVVMLYGVETPYMGEETCHEYVPSEPSVSLSDGMVDSTYPYAKEEGTPYI